MFNKDFYPTPASLAAKMAAMIDRSFSKRILEPSAGKGDLADAVSNRFSGYNRGSKYPVDCIEYEPELRAALSGKGYRVIDSDFLAYQPSKSYDTIIMNPPFSNGVKHVLKAWEIIYNGDVIALLNAESLLNISDKDRRLLVETIKCYGEVEYIENAFVDAERKTGVKVALIHLRKRNSVNNDYFEGLQQTSSNDDVVNEIGNQLAIPQNRIENMVIAFDKAVNSKREAVIKGAEANYYANLIKGEGSDQTGLVKNELNNFVDDLRKNAWREVIRLTDFNKYVTERVRKELDSENEKTANLEFTTANIKAFLQNLMTGYGQIVNECIFDVFDKLTKYHEENRVHVEGWKSNDYFFVNKRVVLPRMTRISFSGGIEVDYGQTMVLDDLDRVMSHVSGKKEFLSMSAVLKTQGCEINKKYESEFFDFRLFKKGTMHFYFRDLKLLEQFNLIVGRERNWLPKEDKKVPENFWLMNGVAA